jgi:hypothetical protein
MPLAPLGQRGRDSTRGVDILAKAGGNDGLVLAYRVPYCRSHGAVADGHEPLQATSIGVSSTQYPCALRSSNLSCEAKRGHCNTGINVIDKQHVHMEHTTQHGY